MLRRQRAVEIVPGSKPLRWRRYDVPQHLAPETSDALRFCAVEGDLDLPDRCHRSTIAAGSFAVSTGPTAVIMMTEGRGFSNAKAKRELDWKLRYPSWRQGFKEELA
jgi:hypothetical protein